MNKVMLTGNLCKDNEIRVIQGTDTKVIHNAIAVKRTFKNAEGTYDSDFINITVFGPSVNFMSQYTGKGDKVGVTGRWNHRTWKDEAGTNHYADECIVENIELLAKAQSRQTSEATPEPAVEDNPFTLNVTSEDLPF